MQANTQTIDRRSFLKGSLAAGALTAASLSVASCDSDTPAGSNGDGSGDGFEQGVAWDSEYDVIVVGLGGAGASAAITAADEGAKVLVLEKAPEGWSGGSSAVCMQWIGYTEDKARCLEYFKALRVNFESPSDEMLSVYVDGIAQNKSWVESLGAPNVKSFEYAEFPEFPGVEAFTPITVNGRTEEPTNLLKQDGAAYKLLKDNVVKRADSIDVWYEAPAVRLIQNPFTKVICGVVANVEGAERNIRARNGVVLCSGGFENNASMQQNFIQRTFNPSLGRALWNEGDGIIMAMEVGAALNHMSNCVTNNGEFFDWETMTASFGFRKPGIMVGKDGSRMSTARGGMARHGKTWVAGTWTNANYPDELWTVFDQDIKETSVFNQCWTNDLSYETAKGWVLSADTVLELGQKMGFTAEASTALADTVEKYNRYCSEGYDPQFEIAPTALRALSKPPFYAIKLQVCLTNTQGGPKKNPRGEIVDPWDEPIPHLYLAGEMGDVWSNLYQASNNFGGGMIFGRISGANAAAPKDDNFQGSLMEGKTRYQPTIAEKTFETSANQYIGKAMGRGQAPLVLRMTIDDNKIANIEILEHYEHVGLPKVAIALENIPKAMIDKNATSVDTVSGATLTSGGIIAAALDAYMQAEIADPKEFTPGTYTGSGQGFKGTITVTITVNANAIVSVDEISDPGESINMGGKEAIADGTFAQQILSAQSSHIDGVTGATITSSGVSAAVRDALQQAAK